MAPTLADADRMIDAAERSGALFRVFENFRSYEPFLRAKALVDAGEIGDPLAIRAKMVMGRGLGGWTVPNHALAWRREREHAGDSLELLDGGFHIASIVTFFMGPVERVHTTAHTVEERPGVRRPVPPMAVAWKHTGSPACGFWEIVSAPDMLIRTDYYPGDDIVEVTGTKGIVWVNRASGNLLGAPPVTLYRDGRLRHFEDVETDLADSFRRAGLDFISAIRDGTQPQLDPREARSVLAFSLAAVRSAVERREMALADLTATPPPRTRS
ncbi:MAG: Gfo/Idh/MocA family oxidoreductase [Gemmatimonadetes bacterium]|nr:Gfo/Idh/MocA family oxidoreductase [Gemmatimonadota bacterium]